MKFQFNIFLAALGLAFILEGLPYFLAPGAVKRMLVRMLNVQPSSLRLVGLGSMAAGLILVALARFFG
jgi:uncharacterized protein YjeT (DUF2065 family)